MKDYSCHANQLKFAPFFSRKNSVSVLSLFIEFVDLLSSVYLLLACTLLPQSILFPVTSEPSDISYTKIQNNMRALRSKAPQIKISYD